MKSIIENFRDLSKQVEKVREWRNKETSENFLLDAYSLAKAIQEKYDYDVKPVEILTELGINIVIEESTENKSFDYCNIELESNGQINISIKYYIDRERSYNNKYFYSLYALVAIIVLEEYNNHKYTIDEQKENDIIERVALFLLYLKYDYKYRKRCYNIFNGKYLPAKHLRFYSGSMLDENVALMDREKLFFSNPRVTSERSWDKPTNVYDYSKHDLVAQNIINKMRNVVQALEKIEEYESISQIECPKDLYEKHQSIDYCSIGKPKKIPD